METVLLLRLLKDLGFDKKDEKNYFWFAKMVYYK
jgi:hypothetical protein